MQSRLLSFTALAAAALLGACQSDVASPTRAVAPTEQPSFLLGPGEGIRTIVDSVDARGNTIMVAEYAAGTYFPNGEGTDGSSVASITIRTFIPAAGGQSSSGGPCITSTIQAVETTPGWTSSVRKSGGCDKPIEVELENKQTKQNARFSFLMIPGKTRIDFGAVR
jgi:hypothetical protein